MNGTLLIATSLAIASPPHAASSADEQCRRLLELDQRVAALEGGAGWLTARWADEIRGLVHDVLSDADTRSSLLAQDAAAGHDGHFFIASADGGFRLEMSGQVQVRHVLNHQGNSDEDDHRWGFENRRTKLVFSGHVGSERLRFRIKNAFDDEDGEAGFEDAHIIYALADDLDLTIGRFRPKVLREERSSSSKQLLAERSLVRRAFRQSRHSGLSLTRETGAVWFQTAVVDLGGSPLADDAWAVSARGELLLDGRRRDLRDLTSFRGDAPATSLGAAVSHEDRGNDDDDDEETTRLTRWTVDLSVEFGGASAMAAFVGNHVEENGERDRDQYGVVLQGGVFLTDDLELVARYQWGDSDNTRDDLSVIEVGFNRYFDGHDLKLTFDVGYGINAVSGLWDSEGAGWRQDENDDDDGQVVVRTQLQLLF